MGNLLTALAAQPETSIGRIDAVAEDVAAVDTPTRGRSPPPPPQVFDPRSPTVDIDRTPIVAKAVVHREVLERKSEAFQDPRSPTVGIDRTPMPTLASVATASPLSTTVDAFVSTVEVANVISDDAEEVQRLEKVLDFHEPEPDVVLEDVVEQLLRVQAPAGDAAFRAAILATSTPATTPATTPAPSPVKSSLNASRAKRAAGRAGFDQENQRSVKKQSPAATQQRRTPFAEVNRPSAASSPRLQLQTRQKLNVQRSVITSQSSELARF